MNKEEIKEIKDFNILNDNNIDYFSYCFADGFSKNSLINYFKAAFCDAKCTKLVWKISMLTFKNNVLGVATYIIPNAATIFIFPKAKSITLLSYIKAY